MADRIKQRISDFSDEQLIDWVCLSCVDVRNTYSEEDAQDFINDIREALEMRFSQLKGDNHA